LFFLTEIYYHINSTHLHVYDADLEQYPELLATLRHSHPDIQGNVPLTLQIYFIKGKTRDIHSNSLEFQVKIKLIEYEIFGQMY